MKFKIFLGITFIYLVMQFTKTHAQSPTARIDGFLVASPYNYAYLFLPDRSITIKKPIVNKKFSFLVNKEKEFETAILYFGSDSARTYADIIEKRNEGLSESLIIALDDSVLVNVSEVVKDSQLIGGDNNKAISAMNEAIKTGNYKAFFEEHGQSPVALMLLGIVIKVEKRIGLKAPLDYEKIYKNLPEDLQNSKKGKEIREMLKDKN